MLIKRLFATVLTGTIVLGTNSLVMGAQTVTTTFQTEAIVDSQDQMEESDVQITKDEAKEIASNALREMFNISIDEKEYKCDIVLRTRYYINEDPVWEIEWNTHTSSESIYIMATINADTGAVVALDKNQHIFEEEEVAIASITEEEAEKIGENFLHRIHPEEFLQTQPINEYKSLYRSQSPDYYFRYERLVDGVPFQANYMMVGVNGRTGEIFSYNYVWNDDLVFPDVKNTITKEEATAIFRDKMGMKLTYRPKRDPRDMTEKIEEVKMIYTPDDSQGYMIDAINGEFLTSGEENTEEPVTKNITNKQKQELLEKAPKKEKPQKELDNNEGSKQIMKIVESVLKGKYEVTRLEYMEDENDWETKGKKAWSARFQGKEDTQLFEDGKIIIDAVTGELISLRVYSEPIRYRGEELKQEKKLTWEEAYDQAINLVAAYFPDKLNLIETEQIYRENTRRYNNKEYIDLEYRFYFPRIVNGIPYSSNDVTVVFDSKSGKVNELSCEWDDVTFPSLEIAIPPEKAVKTYFDSHEPILQYTIDTANKESENKAMEIQLIYRMKSKQPMYAYRYIDAVTGKMVDYDGIVVTEEKQNDFLEQIKGHKSEKELKIMASQGIIDPEEFKLSQEITKMDLIRMMVEAKGFEYYTIRDAEDLKFTDISKEDKDYKYLQAAVKYGFIDNREETFQSESNIQREQMAEMLIKYLGYEKLAKIYDIFKLDMNDADEVDQSLVGYVAIARGFNLFGEQEELFRPKDNVTMEEAVQIIYNVLSNTTQK